MSTFPKAVLAALVLVLPVLSAPASAKTLILNGSFEDGVPGDSRGRNNGARFDALAGGSGASWDVWQSLDGWTTVSGSGIEVQTRRTLGLAAADGAHYLELDSNNNSVMEQMLSLTRGRYKLSFAYSPRMDNAGTNGIAFSLGDALSGSVTGPNPAKATRVGAWTVFEYDLKIDIAGEYGLSFGAIGRSDSLGGLLDNVQLSPVPVPAAGLMLAGGLGLIGALRRRRKA